MRRIGLLFVAACLTAAQPSLDLRHGDLKVSANGRFLIHADGTPFFYLGDTAWELFHRLTLDETERYLEDRRQKGFTVIQAVVLAELDGLKTPNAEGELPLRNNDPAQPNEAYFKHVDAVVASAQSKGMYIGMLPTWADKVFVRENKPVIFNAENARVYGRYLGSRYKDAPNIIWILGGDRPAQGVEPVWRAMAQGLKEGDGGRHLKTFHPSGHRSSGEWLHNEDWLDFNMMQSGHREKDLPNYDMITADYNRQPVKPVFDGEPRYDDHPVMGRPMDQPAIWFDEFDSRQAAYWALFAGAFGHTYGVHPIWQMYAPGRPVVNRARHYWYEDLDLPGAFQMGHVRRLLESRPFLTRVPDQSILVDPGSGAGHLQASRGVDYLFVYSPFAKPFQIRGGKISGKRVKAWWYDPREGKATAIGLFKNAGLLTFTPPPAEGRGHDWILVVDDASRRFPQPGMAGR